MEHAKVHGFHYGTTFAAINKVNLENKICILDIDTQGVQKVKRSKLPCKFVFILPPSIEELEKRLRDRGTEEEDKIVKRMADAAGEIEFGKTEGNVDAVLTNEDVDKCTEELVELLKTWYPKHEFQ